LFQAIGARDPATIETMTITASGGPFREWSADRISAATREEALAHPNWVMGPKVTIDSAGLMNKGLELIEAHHLFGLPADRLDVVVHPQSIVHGLIAFVDGSLIAGMASPDMRTPIAHCLAYPDRIASGVRAPDLAALGRLTFERADLQEFLDGRGIDTRTIWTGNVTRQPMLGGVEVRRPPGGLPESDAVMERGVLLPLSHAIDDDTLEFVIRQVEEFLTRRS